MKRKRARCEGREEWTREQKNVKERVIGRSRREQESEKEEKNEGEGAGRSEGKMN